MADIEFNLLREPWIRVMRQDCQVEEVSLTDALLHAHEFTGLAGELPTQDAAVLRLLLALLHAVFERVDITGKESEIETADDALERWAELWEMGQFPEKPILTYLEAQQDKFWLFHPTRPFWQIPTANCGTGYDASKLNGRLSESSNKLRLFPECTGAEKKRLSFAEAARWLLYVNAFDDTSAKPTKAGKADNDGKLPSPGAGWLGKVGFVCLNGNNLFETLMLNFVLTDEKDATWTSCIPAWELETPRSKERTEIPLPHDQAALLTLQSRRLILHRDGKYVTGFHLLGGDFFAKENAFTEQMTVWATLKDKKGNVIGYQPRRHSKSRQVWRDFSSYVPTEKNVPIPGVIRWNAQIQRNGQIHDKTLRLSIASVQYGDKDYFVTDMFSDTLSFNLNLLSELGEVYRQRIVDMVARCDRTARIIGRLASDLFLASGGDIDKMENLSKTAREKYYYEIDIPFRKWLASLDANDSPELGEQKIDAWCWESDAIAQRIAEKMVHDAGQPAFVGNMITIEKDKKRYYSSSQAMKRFRDNMRNIDKQ